MSFSTENRRIREIFERSAVYIVPRYQRAYVWKEINWKELLADIEFTLNNGQSLGWSHFLGTIVLNDLRKNSSSVKEYEIIDGQQRLMTIYILFMCIYKLCIKLDIEVAKNRAEYIYNSLLTSLTMDSKKELLISNETYDMQLKEILDACSSNEYINKKGELYDLFHYFESCLDELSFHELDTYLNRILDINIVEIISGEEEEIYNIFEVLNARGQKLRQIDLLKNHIMKYIQPRENRFIDEAKEKWQKLIDNTSDLSDPDVLIQHFAKCYIEKDAENQSSIYRLIKEEISVKDLNLFLDDLVEFSSEYKIISNKNIEDIDIEYFNLKHNQQIRSLLCAIYILFKNQIISEKSKNEAIHALRNFFFLFNTTQQTSNRTDKIMSSIAYKIYHAKTEIQFKFIFTELLIRLEEYIKGRDYKLMFENNRTFRYSNKDRLLKKNSRLVKYLLLLYCKSFQTDSYLNKDELTIEHLLSDDGTDKTNSIWNMTLTSQEINSEELKNHNIENKIKILNEISTIKVNRLLGDNYIDNDFNLEKRKEKIINFLIDVEFRFSSNIFNLTKEDVNNFKLEEEFVQNDKELLELLYDTGKFFKIKLENSSEYRDLYKRYGSLSIQA